MLFHSLAAALVALLPCLVTAGPVQKRYTGATIRSSRNGQCLTLQAGLQVIDGSLLHTGDCSTATRWDINPGSGSVLVSGLNFALDAGTNPHNNVPAKVWTSYPGLSQQTWYLTADNRIAITGGNQCLDQGDNGPQTYQCTTGNTNQIWYVDGGSSPSSSVVPSSTIASSTSSAASASASPTGAYHQIQWTTNRAICATVLGAFANGTPVDMSNCFNPTSPAAVPQRFYVSNSGAIQLAGTNYCLDAGINPNNGVQMKIWQCYPGLAQQTWNYINGQFQTANNQCLDLENQGFRTLQTWECSLRDPQQQFLIA